MTTLAEIETAAETLPQEQQHELVRFLLARLRPRAAPLPPPRQFSREEITGWIAQDEADMERFGRDA